MVYTTIVYTSIHSILSYTIPKYHFPAPYIIPASCIPAALIWPPPQSGPSSPPRSKPNRGGEKIQDRATEYGVLYQYVNGMFSV